MEPVGASGCQWCQWCPWCPSSLALRSREEKAKRLQRCGPLPICAQPSFCTHATGDRLAIDRRTPQYIPLPRFHQLHHAGAKVERLLRLSSQKSRRGSTLAALLQCQNSNRPALLSSASAASFLILILLSTTDGYYLLS